MSIHTKIVTLASLASFASLAMGCAMQSNDEVDVDAHASSVHAASDIVVPPPITVGGGTTGGGGSVTTTTTTPRAFPIPIKDALSSGTVNAPASCNGSGGS